VVVGQDGRMAIAYALDPPITDDLRERVVALWVEVTNAGGAVGFVPPVGAADVREAERLGRAMGLAALQVTVRGGTGTERFYERLGYTEVGRLPGRPGRRPRRDIHVASAGRSLKHSPACVTPNCGKRPT
jgi:hypothetical protein